MNDESNIFSVLKGRKFTLIFIFFLFVAIFAAEYISIKPKELKIGLGAIPGDINSDGVVDIIDFQLLSNSFGKTSGQSGYNVNADFNHDNVVDILDFQVLSNNFGHTGTTITPTPRVTVMPTLTSGPTPTFPPTNYLPAFPGAEGFGAKTVGGRGGRVIEVTNLDDSGTGSLRACATASGPRICVFRTGGTITLSSDIDITNPYLTIAGQTAPGGGITLKSASSKTTVHMQVRAPEVIIRYIRSRPGTNMINSRALSMNNGASSQSTAVRNLVIDHNSFSWSGDELTIAWAFTNNISYQWNIASESLPPIDDSAGDTGIKGPSFGETGGGYFSVHHNLIAHHTQRLPQISASVGTVDFVNNVIYNPGGLGSAAKNGTHVNYIKNYIRKGPNSRLSTYIDDGGNGAKGPAAAIYLEGNILDGIQNLINSTSHVVSSRLTAPPVSETTAQTAYNDVLQKSGNYQGLDCNGNWYSRRDSVDLRIVQSVIDRTRGHNIDPSQTFQQLGYISRPSDVGGWPSLSSGTPCTDSDHDGMPDAWEVRYFGNTSHGSPSNSGSDFDGDGYTDLEEYFNSTNPTVKDR